MNVLSNVRAAVIGEGALAVDAVERIGAAGASIVVAPRVEALESSERDAIDAAIVTIQAFPADANEAAAALDGVISLLRQAPGLRRLVVIGVDGPGASLARTLAVYATAHTVDRDVRINALVVPPEPDDATRQRLAEVVTLMLSGLLDAVRGQTFAVGAGDEREAIR